MLNYWQRNRRKRRSLEVEAKERRMRLGQQWMTLRRNKWAPAIVSEAQTWACFLCYPTGRHLMHLQRTTDTRPARVYQLFEQLQIRREAHCWDHCKGFPCFGSFCWEWLCQCILEGIDRPNLISGILKSRYKSQLRKQWSTAQGQGAGLGTGGQSDPGKPICAQGFQ